MLPANFFSRFRCSAMNRYIVRNGTKADEYVLKDETGQAYDVNIFRKQLQLHNASQRNGYIFKPHESRLLRPVLNNH